LVATGFLLIVLLAGMRWRGAKTELATNKPADDRCDDGKKD
jgi:hypothetical protein